MPKDLEKIVASYQVTLHVRGNGAGERSGQRPPTVKYVGDELAKELHRLTGYDVTATATRIDK